MQNGWYSKEADEIQHYADTNNTKLFYDALITVYGTQTTGSSPLLSSDGSTLLTDKADNLQRLAEHSDSVLNRPSHINDDVLAQLPQVKMNMSLDDPPTVAEVEKVIAALSNDKAPGSDDIPVEIYKAGGIRLAIKINELFKTVCSAEGVPQEFKDASIVHLYTRKGNRQCCDNHRGISLLSIVDTCTNAPESSTGAS